MSQVDMFLPPPEMSILVIRDQANKVDHPIDVVDVIQLIDIAKKEADELGNAPSWVDIFINLMKKNQSISLTKTSGLLLANLAIKKWTEVKKFSSPEQSTSASGESESLTIQE